MFNFNEPLDQNAIETFRTIRETTGCSLEEATRIYEYWMGQAYADPCGEWESVT